MFWKSKNAKMIENCAFLKDWYETRIATLENEKLALKDANLQLEKDRLTLMKQLYKLAKEHGIENFKFDVDNSLG